MKTIISLFIFTFIFQVTGLAQVSDTALINVRNFKIKKKRVVSLQSPIEKFSDIVIKSNDTHYYLKRESFAGVDSIDLEINSTNQIEKVTCFYDSLTTYRFIVKAFNKHLKYNGKRTKLENTRRTKWEDKYTTFEIIEVRTGNKRKVYCEIKDKVKN